MPSNPGTLKPFWSTTDGSLKLYWGDVIDVLRRLPERSVQCVVTSPPYWGLRDYGIEGQIGSERTPDLFVAKMVDVFREVRRVLRDDGCCFLNLGDSYYNGGNLVGIPWRVALALQADGWILRQDIIWHKPSPMPESVKNRCTKAHEYVFLLVKQSGYFYDAEAVKETAKEESYRRYQAGFTSMAGKTGDPNNDAAFSVKATLQKDGQERFRDLNGRNKRSVWTIASQGYEGAHFACFPPKLVEPCLLAGTSAYGSCVKCGAPWKRVTEEEKLKRSRPRDYVKRTGEEGTGNSCSNSVAGVAVKTVGWEPTCKCGIEEVKPCTVLDIFVGSGTTLEVALAHGRYGIGIDLSEKYLRDNAIPRLEGALMTRPNLVHLAGRTAEKVELGESVGEESGADEG